MLPFTVVQFLDVFRAYNVAIWPAQIVAYGIGVLAVMLLRRGGASAGRIITAILASMWLWTGAVYHAAYFATVNPAAWGFAALFVLQGLLLLGEGLWRDRLRFELRRDWRGIAGAGLVLYAMLLYPLIGLAVGERWPAMPVFGVTPCPVTIVTLGFLLAAERPRRRLLVVPLLWSVIGGSAALLLGVPQDWMLLLGGAGTAALMRLRPAAHA